MEDSRLTAIAKTLLTVTDGCRADLHEPDNQHLRVTVVGDHLDNAMGSRVIPELLVSGSHEFLVCFHRYHEARNVIYDEPINLADLIALARYGAQQRTRYEIVSKLRSEVSPSADAVDPVPANSVEPSTRDNSSSSDGLK